MKTKREMAAAGTENHVHQWRRWVLAAAAVSGEEVAIGADLGLGGSNGSSETRVAAAAEVEEESARKKMKWARRATSPPPGYLKGQEVVVGSGAPSLWLVCPRVPPKQH